MSEDKGTNPANDDGQVSDEQLEEVAGGTGCVYIPPQPGDPDIILTNPNDPIVIVKFPWLQF